MSTALRRTDWSILSTLLRLAQREGWRVAFEADRVLVAVRWPAPGVLTLPARLMRHARAAGWHAAFRPGAIALSHPAVRHRVEVSLRG